MSTLERILNRLSLIERILARQEVILEDHTKRSTSNEQVANLLKQEVDLLKNQVSSFSSIMWGLAGFIGLLASVATIYEAFFKA